MKYFVSYKFYEGDKSGYGNAEIQRENKIQSYEDIKGICEDLKLKNKIESIIILFWREF